MKSQEANKNTWKGYRSIDLALITSGLLVLAGIFAGLAASNPGHNTIYLILAAAFGVAMLITFSIAIAWTKHVPPLW
jgi:hypothetical protein